MNQMSGSRRRGGPLIMLGVLLGAWVSGRAALWENPFPMPDIEFSGVGQRFADSGVTNSTAQSSASHAIARPTEIGPTRSVFAAGKPLPTLKGSAGRTGASSRAYTPGQSRMAPQIAAGHIFLLAAAFEVELHESHGAATSANVAVPSGRSAGVNPVAPPHARPRQDMDRWSLDAFAFYRAGSNSTAISQGRVPVYGASQAGANLQHRIAPASRHDPRAYVRAYRAFVPGGENEVAAGLSARPIGGLPLRAYAEVRVTDNIFGTEVRPAAFAVTELAPASLPLDFSLEAYGGAGYVGGVADTPFVDGQIAVTREVARLGPDNPRPVRFSVGGGSWGGAQEDANRLDVGPTMRVDLTIGDAPARLSLDWRERIAGDASPTSGLAATLSTRF